MARRPRIAFLTSVDAARPSAWSGIPYFMARALEAWCGEVTLLGPYAPPVDLLYRIEGRMRRAARLPDRPWIHRPRRSRAFGREFGRRIGRRLRGDFDVIFAPAASTEIAHLDTAVPIVYSSDTTFELLAASYAEFAQPSERAREEGDALERAAIRRAARSVYPSRWAAESAIGHYGADPDAVRVFPYGANLPSEPRRSLIRAHARDRCRLLFIGKDWKRKGGDTAVAVLDALASLGRDATLDVVGCDTPIRHAGVRVHGPLRKDHPTEGARLERLLRDSDFLLLPTRAECFGIVFCEASAYALPSIAANTGGVGGAVADGENGYLVDEIESPEAYARILARLSSEPAENTRLRRSARRRFERELSWDVWGKRMAEVFEELW